MTLRSLLLPIALVGALLPAKAQGRGPSTPEERARVLKLAAESDKEPLRVQASDGRWFEKWMEEIPDITFGPEAPARWMESSAKGDLRRVMRFKYELGGVVYMIEHRIANSHDTDQVLQIQQAALESVLRAYASLRDLKPENRSEKWDEALALVSKGEFTPFVKSLLGGKRG